MIAFGVATAAQFVAVPSLAVETTTDLQVHTALAYEDTTSAHLTISDTERIVREYFADVPILAEVAWCESRFQHTDPVTGKVTRGIVNPDDVGVMQINQYYHTDTAEALGIDLMTLEGNMAYARNLYEREGTAPWNASRACWNSAALAIR